MALFSLNQNSLVINNSNGSMAFVGSTNKTSAIYYFNNNLDSPIELVKYEKDIINMAWSPAGNKIAFLGINNNHVPQLCVYDIPKRKVKKIVKYDMKYNFYNILFFSWIDVNNILYYDIKNNKNKLHIIDVNKSCNKYEILLPLLDMTILDISTSHNGKFIAVADLNDIYVYNTLDKFWKKITAKSNGTCNHLKWSLDDNKLFYNQGAMSVIYNFVENDHIGLIKYIHNMEWLPIENQIVYNETSINNDNSNLFMYNINANIFYKLTNIDDGYIRAYSVLNDSFLIYEISYKDKKVLQLLNIKSKQNNIYISNQYSPRLPTVYFNKYK
jgi:hypothetical protein